MTRLNAKMKKLVETAFTSKTIFTGKLEEDKYQVKQKAMNIRKGIFINCLALNALIVKRLVKAILALPFRKKRYGALVKLIPKWMHKLNIRQ